MMLSSKTQTVCDTSSAAQLTLFAIQTLLILRRMALRDARTLFLKLATFDDTRYC